MNEIKFTQDHLQKAEDFSNAVNTSLYARRNQWDAGKRKLDSKIGKLGELAVYETLKPLYDDLSYPDFAIYSAKQKSWDYDLKAKDINLHVKCQNIVQAQRYGESWIFELTDKHIFKDFTDKDYVAFVTVDMVKGEGYIKSILPVSVLHKNALFKKPKLDKLISKAAVYFDDVKTFSNSLI
jgi:hypothetical protein